MSATTDLQDLEQYRYGWHDQAEYSYLAELGPREEVLREMSALKGEPAWMLERRLRALRIFERKPMPAWGPDLTEVDFDSVRYYIRPGTEKVSSWEELPEEMRRTYDRLGIPEAERNWLAGVTSQYDSESVLHRHLEVLDELGVIFCDMDTGLREHPELVKRYFGTVIPPADNKFAALNSAFWSGGSFLYVPAGVEVPLPVTSYFRINAERAGQFERTLIVVEPGAKVHYLEGCSSPIYSTNALHAAVVEIVVGEGAECRYTTVQNWSSDVFNLVTKRARVEARGKMIWTDANVGSKVTQKYPSCYLVGDGAHGEVTSLSFAGPGQLQDTGAKMVHVAPNTTSTVVAKSVSRAAGRTNYRGLVRIEDTALGARSHVRCDTLLLDEASASSTYPVIENGVEGSVVEHEASVSKVSEDQLFYLRARGLSENQARSLIVCGFAAEVAAQLPAEYSVELTRLLELETEGSVG